MEARLRKFGLELHPDQTRLIEFGRFAEDNRKRGGEGKPETFDFLGFTHFCGRTRSRGYFNYHAIPGNGPRLQAFRDGVTRLWRQALGRRGQSRAYPWERMPRLVHRWLPSVRILHPYPHARFAANHPR